MSETIPIAVNGFGRIGVVVTRQILDAPDVALVAVGGRELVADDIADRLSFDTVHGELVGHEAESVHEQLFVDHNPIGLVDTSTLHAGTWEIGSERGLIVVDATGVYKTHEKASLHTAAGAGAVVVTSPVKDEAIPTIVRGVNDTDALLEQAALQRVVAVSSCSTNCIAPILKLFSDHVAIESASAQVVHARTNSQPHLDGRGNATSDRRSADNIVVATTGSATEVQRLLPRLPFYSNSIRVPVPDGSLAMINMEIAGKITDANVVGMLVEASNKDTVIGVTDHNMFSTRIVGNPHSSVVDLNRVRVTPHVDRTSVELQAWFDNEWGYSARVLEVATRIGQIVRS